jgi:hypothetical protein
VRGLEYACLSGNGVSLYVDLDFIVDIHKMRYILEPVTTPKCMSVLGHDLLCAKCIMTKCESTLRNLINIRSWP